MIVNDHLWSALCTVLRWWEIRNTVLPLVISPKAVCIILSLSASRPKIKIIVKEQK